MLFSHFACLAKCTSGCSRYVGGHAHAHFSETGHTFSLNISTQKVWDYAGDGYVHRLVASTLDAKPVELAAPSRE
jgi:BRCA1-associated protein